MHLSTSAAYTDVPGISQHSAAAHAVRHSGWLFSVGLALAALVLYFFALCCWEVLLGLWWTALDALTSDLLQVGTDGEGVGERFFCGNFGLVLLNAAHAPKVRRLLETMVRVTMMRGAQSAGLVTYTPKGEGVRRRVVNGKRTDLCNLLLAKMARELRASAIRAPAIFQGHTRFATSSIAGMAGCHPHQWCPAQRLTVWSDGGADDGAGPSGAARYTSTEASYETYITHNGDLDFFSLHGYTYPLDVVQGLLAAVLHVPVPATVDSACVAGLLDLLRTKGMWRPSVRYGYVYGALADVGDLSEASARATLWSRAELDAVVAFFEGLWSDAVIALTASHARTPAIQDDGIAETRDDSSTESGSSGNARPGVAATSMLRAHMEACSLSRLSQRDNLPAALAALEASTAEALARSAIRAFFEQDLLAAARQLLANAVGSFGLVLSTSIDAQREIVVASRGQTMSIGFFPQLGAFLFASEASATKAGLGAVDSATEAPAGSVGGRTDRVAPPAKPFSPSKWGNVRTAFGKSTAYKGFEEGFRFDLDDVNGEVVLLRWGTSSGTGAPMVTDDRSKLAHGSKAMTEVMQYGENSALWTATYQEARFGSLKPFMRRVLPLGSNPLVLPIPTMGGGVAADPVGRDIADIDRILTKIHDDWNEPSSSLNRLTMLTFQQQLRKRMLAHAHGTHDGSVDLLIAGCEVSLWLGEQFASDLHRAFPRLKIVSLSANKLLGLLGQGFCMPQVGFSFHEASYDFSDSCVLLVSQSGGTFATLNVSNLLKGFTRHIFVVTSEWDTQVARSVRAGKPGGGHTQWNMASYVFTNFCGCRPAEPCSLTVAATHQLLTQILLHLMYAVRHYEPGHPRLAGSSFTIDEVQELETLNRNTLDNLARLGRPSDPTRQALRRQAALWAQHILEGPVAWILSALYILFTVVSGYTPLSATVLACCYASTGVWGWGSLLGVDPHADPIKYVVGLADAVLYAFLPWWITIVLRLVQGRPWHHRVAGRSLLIGDIPWVAQSLEAFVSKLFALSYSIASLSVSSGNPADHLVHRHTHRVVRGGLLAVGRPDGRLNALASAEATVCLSVNQASSIQNMGVTLESFTLGHNPHKLDLSAGAVFLPTTRPKFFSEWLLGAKVERGTSASSIMGMLGGVQESAPPPARKSSVGENVEVHFAKIEPRQCKKFVGDWMLHDPALREESNATLMDRQLVVQALYEGRMASLERFVGFLHLFYALGKRVQDFWPAVSCGMLGYDMSRSHSIMRIATTASPVSGAEVRIKMLDLAEETRRLWAVRSIQLMYRFMRREKGNWEVERLKREFAELKQAQVDALSTPDAGKRQAAITSLVSEAVDHTAALKHAEDAAA